MSDKKVAVVTGGATGIGAACVRELAAKGFRVVISVDTGIREHEALARAREFDPGMPVFGKALTAAQLRDALSLKP